MTELENSRLCPDCHSSTGNDLSCQKCGWQASLSKSGIPILLKKNQSETWKRYADNYDEIAKDDLSVSIQDKSYLETQARKFRGYLGDLAGKRVCEVGVGQGRLFSLMRESNPKKLTGVDIATQYLGQIAAGEDIELIVADAENLPFKNSFDLIVASDIVEHVMNVGDCMISLNRALAVGGRVVIKVPYRENLIQYARQFGCKYEFVHLRTFDRPLLEDLLKSAGFMIERVHYDGFHAMNARRYIRRSKFLSRRFDAFVASRSSPNDIAKMPNWLGQLLMKPSEITMVGKKITQLGYA